jgi:hypothetical protein
LPSSQINVFLAIQSISAGFALCVRGKTVEGKKGWLFVILLGLIHSTFFVTSRRLPWKNWAALPKHCNCTFSEERKNNRSGNSDPSNTKKTKNRRHSLQCSRQRRACHSDDFWLTHYQRKTSFNTCKQYDWRIVSTIPRWSDHFTKMI